MMVALRGCTWLHPYTGKAQSGSVSRNAIFLGILCAVLQACGFHLSLTRDPHTLYGSRTFFLV